MKNMLYTFLLLLSFASVWPLSAQESKVGKSFTFTNRTNKEATDLHLTLTIGTKPINFTKDETTGELKVGGIFENYPSEKVTLHTYKTSQPVAIGGTVKIQFDENTAIKKWYWTKNDTIIEGAKGAEGGEMHGKHGSITVISLDQPNDALIVSATGTGRTTGHIANLTLYNPTNQAIATEIAPCFIPSNGKYQSYIVPELVSVTVPPYTTANISVNGYCADIFSPPVPIGTAMPPVSTWVGPEQDATVAVLLDAVRNISTAYNNLKDEGRITTPFSGNPEAEYLGVVQQCLWRYTAEQNGRRYDRTDFEANTIKQFEASTGLVFKETDEKTRNQVNVGIDQFWSTFEAVGEKAKVLAADDVDYDKIEKADDLPKLIRPAYDRYAAARALGSSHGKAMKDAFSNEKARDEWDARFKKIYNKNK